MHIHQVTDLDALRTFRAVQAAAHDHDYLALPADSVEEFAPLLDGTGSTGEVVDLHLGMDGGVPVGTLTLTFPTLDNLSTASLGLTVHPDHRRRGHARALLDFGITQVQARGRNRIFFEVPSAGGGSQAQARPLMEEVGAKPVLEDVRRLLDLAKHPVGEPVHPPTGYRIVQWVERAPDDVVGGAAYLTGRMSVDSPMGEMDYQQESWDAARYREKEAEMVARHRTRLATAVVHVETGAVAGLTEIGVNRDHPEVAYQWTTIVDPDHRGHGLGLVLKSWNHRLLTERVPDTKLLNTWNAASNSFMIAVNETLGFEVVDHWTEWQLDL
jgi:GNAT superfamily N-acetyltransferase